MRRVRRLGKTSPSIFTRNHVFTPSGRSWKSKSCASDPLLIHIFQARSAQCNQSSCDGWRNLVPQRHPRRPGPPCCLLARHRPNVLRGACANSACLSGGLNQRSFLVAVQCAVQCRLLFFRDSTSLHLFSYHFFNTVWSGLRSGSSYQGGDLKHMRSTADFTFEENEADAMRLSAVFDTINYFPK